MQINRREAKRFFEFALIPLSIFTLVLVIPFIQGVISAFTDWNGFKYTKFVGTVNFKDALTDANFWHTMRFTFMFVIVSTVLVNLIGFALALLVTVKMRGVNLFRTFFFVPNLIGGVILGVIWQFIFGRALLSISKNYDLPFFQESWLIDPTKAFWALIIVTVWQMSGYMMIIYVTGLMSIENDVLEAAKIDGASPFRTLLSIKMPLMVSAFTISIFLTIRNAFMAYDINLALTGGGPYRSTELVSMHVVTEAFDFGNFATGQAKAIVMFLIIAAVAVTQVAISKRMEVQR
jgi:raffinose/stachyose/melibiose transport system permease protein